MWKKLIDLPVWLSPLGLLCCSGAAAFFFPLIPRYAERLADVRTFAPTLLGGVLYAAGVTLAFFLCWLAAQQARRGRFAARLPVVGCVALLLGLPLLFVYPINAADVFVYFLYGRVTAVHGGSPLVSSPSEFPGDPFLRYAGEWANTTSPYGPIWEAIDGLVVHFAHGDLLLSLLSFKAIGLACHLAVGLLLDLLLTEGSAAERASRRVLWFWNPAPLLMFVVDAHNDAVMLFWLCLGFYLTRRGASWLGLSILMLAPLTKIIGVLVLPFVLIEPLLERADLRERLRFLAAVGAIGLVLAMVAFLSFGGIREWALRIWEESRGGASFSILAAVRYLDDVLEGFDPRLKRWHVGATVLFVTGALVLLIRTARGRRPEAGIAETYFLYVCTAARYRIWYAVWVFPWILMDIGGSPLAYQTRLRIAFLFLWTSQVSVVLYGHVYVEWLERSRAAAHFIGVPFVFGVPLLCGLVFFARNRRATGW